MKNIFFCTLLIFLFYGCSSDTKVEKVDKMTFTNDCESIEGWDSNSRAVSTENFHSGRYSNKLDAQNPYSVTFKRKYSDISNSQIKFVKISAWVYFLTNNYVGKALVVEIVDQAGQKLLWEGIDMKEFVKSPKQWIKIEKVIKLDKKYEPNSIFGIYAWNNSNDGILLDDFRIQFIDK